MTSATNLFPSRVSMTCVPALRPSPAVVNSSGDGAKLTPSHVKLSMYALRFPPEVAISFL